jgi:hypothetical protein
MMDGLFVCQSTCAALLQCCVRTLRALARRIQALLPEARNAYLAVCKQKGLTEKGGQLSEEGCDAFFMRLLGRELYAEFRPSREERTPLRELEYTARESTRVLLWKYGLHVVKKWSRDGALQ